jgi:hypothetical protein
MTRATVVYIDARRGNDLDGDGSPDNPYRSSWWARHCHGNGPTYALLHLEPACLKVEPAPVLAGPGLPGHR